MPKKKVPVARMTVRLPEAIHQRAKVAATARREKLQQFVADAVEMRLEAMETELKRKRA